MGRKGLDAGAIVLVFLEDPKVRIEVGYGLEGAIPDIEASRIIREAIAPRFREGRYDAGLEAAARAIYAQVERAAPARLRRSVLGHRRLRRHPCRHRRDAAPRGGDDARREPRLHGGPARVGRVRAVEDLGAALARHFPRGAGDDPDELANEVSTG